MRIRYTRRAGADLAEIKFYLAQQNPRAARVVIAAKPDWPNWPSCGSRVATRTGNHGPEPFKKSSTAPLMSS